MGEIYEGSENRPTLLYGGYIQLPSSGLKIYRALAASNLRNFLVLALRCARLFTHVVCAVRPPSCTRAASRLWLTEFRILYPLQVTSVYGAGACDLEHILVR